jgi:uncharacterized protein (TIGR00369 family)
MDIDHDPVHVAHRRGGAGLDIDPFPFNRRFMSTEALTPLVYDAQHGCFGCGDLNPSGLRLRFFRTPEHMEAGGVVCHFRMPRRFQGPHGFSHGGMIATVLDEAMSKAIHASPHAEGLMAMTRHIEIDYQRPVPLATALVLRAHHGRVEGRKHFCEGTLEDEQGHVLAKGKSVFIAIPRQPEHKH